MKLKFCYGLTMLSMVSCLYAPSESAQKKKQLETARDNLVEARQQLEQKNKLLLQQYDEIAFLQGIIRTMTYSAQQNKGLQGESP